MIEEAKNPDILLFIDEIHNIHGAGKTEGSMDMGELLKPELSRGAIKVIGATTTAEYHKTIEKDTGLARRFENLTIEEPNVTDTITILRGLDESYEKFHGVEITDDALIAAAQLTDKYIKDRSLPDKAITVIDAAATRIKLRIQEEKNQNPESSSKHTVEADDIAEIISEQTGIPLTKLQSEENEKLLNLEKELATRVIGQDEAVSALSDAIRRARIGLKDPKKPMGSFLFL